MKGESSTSSTQSYGPSKALQTVRTERIVKPLNLSKNIRAKQGHIPSVDNLSQRLLVLMLRMCISISVIGLTRVPNAMGKLAGYFEFCDQEYQQVLKHVTCIERTLKNFPSLKFYFLSEGFSDARFKRLRDAFSNPLLKPVLLYHYASIQLFTHFNKLLLSTSS